MNSLSLSKNLFSIFRTSMMAGVYLLFLLAILLAPFDFHFPFFNSGVRKLSNENGVHFVSTAGLKSLLSAEKISNALTSGQGLSVEVFGSAENDIQTGPSRVISISKDQDYRNLTLGQRQRDLIVRLRTTNTDLNGTKGEVKVANVFFPNKPFHIVFTYDHFREKIYINGILKYDQSGPGGDFSNWNSNYPLLLGNEATLDRSYLGKIFLVALYDRVLTETEIQQNFNAGASARSGE